MTIARLALAVLLLCAPLAAKGNSDLKVMRRGSHIWVRISLRNPSTHWEGKMSVRCWARRSGFGPWILLKEWSPLPPLGPGHRLTRELFDQSSPTLRLLAATGPIQVRAVISAPHLRMQEERSLPAQKL